MTAAMPDIQVTLPYSHDIASHLELGASNWAMKMDDG
jgi:hypothetical protein